MLRVMEIEKAREFIRANHRAVLSTRRRSGSAHMSPVLVGIDAEGRAVISTNEGRAKALNLRRDPRASVCVMSNRFFGPWLQIDGSAEVLSLPEATEPLVEYYRAVAGEHADWADYRASLEREQACLIRITIDHAAP